MVQSVRGTTNDESDLALQSLSVTGLTLSPRFNPDTLVYTVSPLVAVTVTVRAEAKYPDRATVSDTGVVYLKPGENAIPVTVTSKDGNTKRVYKIRVTRLESSDATLKSLFIDGKEFSSLKAGIYDYTVNVANATDSITIEPKQNYSEAAVSGGGGYSLSIGTKTIVITVTSEDRTVTNTYRLNVVRPPALSSLTVNYGTLEPEFDVETLHYTVHVLYDVENITIEAETADTANRITGTGTYPLDVGDTVVTISVTSENGTIRDYTVTITQRPITALLQSLTVNHGSLTPEFNSDSLSYKVRVGNEVTGIRIKAEAIHPSIIIRGDTGNYALSTGVNFFVIEVIGAGVQGRKTYTIQVTREHGDATLQSLFVSPGTLAPPFHADTLHYTVYVGSEASFITIMASSNNPLAVVTGAGTREHYLEMGSNFFTVLVLAEDGVTKRNYNLTVVRGELPAAIVPAPGAFSAVQAYLDRQTVYVDSPVSERISIYSLTGALLFSADKAAGKSSFPTNVSTARIWIVRGGSGWVKKLVIKI
jgi:hypothetical protein